MRRTHDLYDAEQFAVHMDFVFVVDADVVQLSRMYCQIFIIRRFC